ncbi:MAG: restriction endonuclease subunit S [Scardovia wiggsiae]|nr:restriction endonuclease subunit S [Scardovia wiggsiae]
MLPVDDKGNPDYAYMTLYSTKVRGSMLMRYQNFIARQLSRLEYKDIPPLEEKEWGEFVLDDIFTVSAGKRLETRNKIEGEWPFIGAVDKSNGITGFVGNDNTSKDKNVLGVNYNGAPCIAFYHPYECVFTDDVKRLHLKKHEDNKYILLFFTSVFSMQKTKYSYGYKFKERRMLKQKLRIPITEAGEPDYEYMEQYAKNMMLCKYKQYVAFIDRQGVTEKVSN